MPILRINGSNRQCHILLLSHLLTSELCTYLSKIKDTPTISETYANRCYHFNRGVASMQLMNVLF